MSGYGGTSLTTWIDTEGITHAAIRERSYTLCYINTGKLIHYHDPAAGDDPIKNSVSCEDCVRKLSGAIARLAAAMAGLPS